MPSSSPSFHRWEGEDDERYIVDYLSSFTSMASSSSPPPLTYWDMEMRYVNQQFDVFLSFSEDTSKIFADHLNIALWEQYIPTFKNDWRLRKGKEIEDEVLKFIEDSKICIIVFSKKYASSALCLDELVRIMECLSEIDKKVYSLFYDVEPHDVREQSGPVGEAFAKHTKNSNKKLEEWRKTF